MSFGRWLLVHSFSISILVLLVLGYSYRAELQFEQAYQQLLNIDPDGVVLIAPDPVTPSSAKPQEKLRQTDQQARLAGEQQPLQKFASVPTVQTGREKEVELPSQDELLILARKAYWEKNYHESIRLYRQLIAENSRNPDYFGELGNIYYALNDNQNASRLYYQAAQIFVHQNQPERARLLVSPIIAMNRDLGNKLKQQLQLQ